MEEQGTGVTEKENISHMAALRDRRVPVMGVVSSAKLNLDEVLQELLDKETKPPMHKQNATKHKQNMFATASQAKRSKFCLDAPSTPLITVEVRSR